METATGPADDEAARLRRCLNDLVSVIALPALWAGGRPPRIAGTTLDALVRILDPAFVLTRFSDPDGGTPVEMVRVADAWQGIIHAPEVGRAFDIAVGDASTDWPPGALISIGGVPLWIAAVRLGLHGGIGVLVAGSDRADFPRQAERLVLDVAANQAALGLQQARILGEQGRVAAELNEHVLQRTSELVAANEALQREVIERRRVEEALIESERESQLIVDSMPGLVALLAADGSVQAVNPQIFEYTGRSFDDLRQWGSNDIVHPEDLPGVIEVFSRSIVSGQPYAIVQRLRRSDGAYRWFQNSGCPIHNVRGEVVRWCVLLTDIDERKRAEVELRRAYDSFRDTEEALNRARSELAHVARVTTLSTLTASIAHEVNQPLSGIVTNAGTCLRMLDADPPNVEGAREAVTRIIRDAHRASDVMTRLRALFSKREFALEPLDLNGAIEEVIALSKGECQRNRIVLQVKLAGNLPAITGDRVQLQQVVLNLLRNALDAMVNVHDRPRTLLISTQRNGDERVQVTVRDVGVGIEAHVMNRLFEPFYTTKGDGMGIGLSISRSIVERHRGRLWVEPNDGPGATFCLSIPCLTERVATGTR